MAIHKAGFENPTRLPRNLIKDAGLRWEEFKFEQKDMSFVEKWAEKKFLCWYCKVQPLPHTARTTEFQLEKDADFSHAVDIFYRCPKCGLNFIFGLPITKGEYDKAKSMGTEVLYV